MSDAPASNARPYETFYNAAIAGLRALDAREGRRFSPEAEAHWAAFSGSLTEGDRVDLLLRDAAVQWGAAFSPAACFGLTGVAPDDPFGPSWTPLGGGMARRLLQAPPVADLAGLGAVFEAEKAAIQLPAFTPSTRVVVAGAGAMLAVAAAFSTDPRLDWSKQVLAVATEPAHRQLAGLLPVFLGAPFPTPLIQPAAAPPEGEASQANLQVRVGDVRAALKAVSFGQPERALVSEDAEPACAAFARAAAGEA